MLKKIIFIYILFLQLSANDFIPLDGLAINYTQVFFKWPQIVESESYILQIENAEGELKLSNYKCKRLKTKHTFIQAI